jgi:hypothetical protein
LKFSDRFDLPISALSDRVEPGGSVIELLGGNEEAATDYDLADPGSKKSLRSCIEEMAPG